MIELTKKIQEQFDRMCSTGKLFRSSVTGQQVWDLYINGFKPKDNPRFRDPESTMHNCNLCKNFIRRYGNIVAVDENYNIITMFNVDAPEEFVTVVKSISKVLRKAKISEVFFETFTELNKLPYESCKQSNTSFKLGVDKNVKRYTKDEAEKFGVVKPDEIRTFTHLHLKLPAQFVDNSGKSIESIMAEFRDSKNVFQRAMQEIPLDTLYLVRDLIVQGSLLDGVTHRYKIDQLIPLKKHYDFLHEEHVNKTDNWLWLTSYKFQLAKFKNELIGVLCSELAEGKELNEACQAWNKRVDPANYMKATAPITKKQIEEAKQFVEENGYTESFDRRFANIDDIKASEIKHINIGDGKVKAVSMFDNIKSTSTRHKRSEFDNVEEVPIDTFMEDILPSCTSVEAYLANKHDGNMVSLTTANVKKSKPIFKWSNNYSWTFNGNLAGKSMIKEAVKSRGGKTEGVVNIRLAFPNTESDYDLHIIEPNRNEIYYSNRRRVHSSSGMLDLDAQGADGMFVPEKRVENIIYTEEQRMPKGKYLVYVNNFSERDRNFGFTIEIEIDGEITTFVHNSFIPNKVNIQVCYINHIDNRFEIIPILPVGESNSISKELYGLQTNEFHKVNLVCLSPNHWGKNAVGNKYYFFMLQGCKNPTSIRSFHIENLIPELLPHKKVMEVLGMTNMIEPTENQLSGLGFNATVRNELIVRLQGSFKRVIKIKF